MAYVTGCVVFVFVLTAASTAANDGTSTAASTTDPTTTKRPDTCRPEFAEEKDHTMCMTDSHKLISYGVSDAEKKIIVDYHNKVRREASPNGTDLTAVIWDDNVAEVAEKLSRQCRVFHDKNRGVPSYSIYIGQNVAAGYGDWTGAMGGWFGESKIYKYGEDPEIYIGPDGWTSIGHYTQMVSSKVQRIGCGFARCKSPGWRTIYTCNYAKGQGGVRRPYTKGEKCSACPDHCNDGLCDCNGLLCLNGGSLDLKTCKCKCQNIYTGTNCSTLVCPEKDVWYCSNVDWCRKFGNIPYECPYLCGKCIFNGTTTTTTSTTTPPPFTSYHNCTHKGSRATPEQCKGYGARGSDTNYCESRGGGWNCDHCKNYYNIKTDYCPVMCGYCDPPCGMICQNRGTLDPDTCKCSCKKGFTGNLCEIDEAKTTTSKPSSSVNPTPTPSPGSPSSICSFSGQKQTPEKCKGYGNRGSDTNYCESRGGGWNCDHCKNYYNIKTDYCPVMCGYCDPPCGMICQNRGTLDPDTCKCTCRKGFTGNLCEIDTSKTTTTIKPTTTPKATTTAKPTTSTSGPPSSICPFTGQKQTLEKCKGYGNRGSDTNYCESRGGGWNCDHCKNYYNIKTDYCPVMCGYCDPPCGMICQNRGTLDPDTCTCTCRKGFTGKLCEIDSSKTTTTTTIKPATTPTAKPTTTTSGSPSSICPFTGQKQTLEKCKGYGNRGSDTNYCESRGGGWNCDHCKNYYNIKTDYCPVMCGYCDPPCGMICQNRGTLDPDTCKCTCRKGFTGNLCETNTTRSSRMAQKPANFGEAMDAGMKAWYQ
ncbi:hypothetical protein RRG08_042601 [Elysia crispata]|uniref:EGF-like domain-containing protein n=1 Tax=Elysia crispata TaxID=231223 RepID=A0AAE0XQ10_9GAST|nr:hypothetical protein RRG08_042601 [Elysia crispata]